MMKIHCTGSRSDHIIANRNRKPWDFCRRYVIIAYQRVLPCLICSQWCWLRCDSADHTEIKPNQKFLGLLFAHWSWGKTGGGEIPKCDSQRIRHCVSCDVCAEVKYALACVVIPRKGEFFWGGVQSNDDESPHLRICGTSAWRGTFNYSRHTASRQNDFVFDLVIMSITWVGIVRN